MGNRQRGVRLDSVYIVNMFIQLRVVRIKFRLRVGVYL